MSSTFIALPLSSGEAFLLRTPDKNGRERVILVDSGKTDREGTRELADILSRISPRIDHIDFAICTHSDADHSKGFWSFADDWYGMKRTLGEYWLPGGWANAMPAILTDPTGFAAKLMDGAMQASQKMGGPDGELASVSREERYYKASYNFDPESVANAVTVLDNEEPPSLEAGLGLSENDATLLRMDYEESDDTVDAFDAALKSMQSSWSPFWPYVFFDKLDSRKFLPVALEGRALFQEVAETAQAIRKIALAAVAHKIRVRWFDFAEYKKTDTPRGGERGLLEPCCAVEVVPDKAKAMALSNLMLFQSLRLTRQNVESLVFYRPENGDEPGVIFLGDSRLAHGIEKPGKPFPLPFVKPKRKLLITAPHHGSRNNDHAFGVLKNWLGTDQQYYVRNGGQAGQTLADYITYSERRCAQCIQCHGKNWNQSVSVGTNGNDWKWPPNAKKCGTP